MLCVCSGDGVNFGTEADSEDLDEVVTDRLFSLEIEQPSAYAKCQQQSEEESAS